MNINESKNALKSNIKGYKLQRTNEIYESLGFNYLFNACQTFSTNIPIIPRDVLLLGTTFLAYLYGFLYISYKRSHALTSEIDRLEKLKKNLKNVNPYQNISREKFEEDLAERLLIKK